MGPQGAGSSAPPAVRVWASVWVAALTVGGLVLLYGAVLAGGTAIEWAELQPPGTTIGPPSAVQLMRLQIDEGLALVAFGGVLVACAVAVRIFARRTARTGGASASPSMRAAIFTMAAAFVLAAAAVTVLPLPRTTLSFQPADFQVQALPSGTPYENYFVSGSISLQAGDALVPWLNLSIADRQTGALIESETPAAVWFTPASIILDWRDPSTWAFGGVVPRDGSYVLWVRFETCEHLGVPPCSNYTGTVRGDLLITSQPAYLPYLFAFGFVGCAEAAVVVVVQSGLGRRRTTS